MKIENPFVSLALCLSPLFLGACLHDDDDNNAPAGGGNPPMAGVTMCDGQFQYDLDGVTVLVESIAVTELAVATVDFANGAVQIQANVNAGNTGTSFAMTFAGITNAGPGTYTPVAVIYNVIDLSTGMPTESYLSLNPADFATTFTALDVTGVTASFTGGNLLGGPIGGAQGNIAVTNAAGDHQTCN